MPPNTAQKIPDDAEFPSLEQLAAGNLGAKRRTARKVTSIPTPANDNELKKQQIASNPYLPKPANDNDPKHLQQFQDGAENAISENMRNVVDPNARFSGSVANDNKPESKNTKSADSPRSYRTPSENFDRSKALYSAANDNKTQLNISKSRQEMNRKIEAVQGVLTKHGIKDVSKREARNMIQHGFKHQFPAGMFALSVTKDFLFDPAVAVASLGLFSTGLATSASVVGAPVGMALSAAGIAFGIANTFIISPAVQGARIVLNRQYVSRLVGKDRVAKKIMRKILVGNVVTALVELPPILQLLPTHTVRTIMVNMLLAKILADCAAAAS
jgi:hypothetical protein